MPRAADFEPAASWRLSRRINAANRGNGNLFFAGEHTSEKFQGFMNGAAETGNRAAVNMMRKMAAKSR